ncbi:MAG: phosphatidylglycerol lysyltransferase domain-containing protein [Oscillospiraceae bacterium]|nr:phosphatidylglycerol lysyltransferase domain-containing protein [Oscillospiraceae bacterium]
MAYHGTCCPKDNSRLELVEQAEPLSFRAPRIEDKPWVDKLLALSEYRGCEYNFTTLFIWNETYRQEIARMEDYLLIRAKLPRGNCYSFPAGQGELGPVIEALTLDARAQGAPLCLIGVTEAQITQMETLFPGEFTFTANRDGSDYLYEIDRLADLGGKRLHAKRNHINRFMEQNPTWQYERVSAASLPECLEMDKIWYKERLARIEAEGGESPERENAALHRALLHFAPLGLDGGLLRVEGKVVAFTLGDRISTDTYDVHFEKAFGEMQGAYAMINREFARQIRADYPEIRYLNREEDMGIPGLRKAKESYYPDLLLTKHSAIRRV